MTLMAKFLGSLLRIAHIARSRSNNCLVAIMRDGICYVFDVLWY